MAFDDIIKSGRTHLQDATPIRLGQEFTAYSHTVQRHRDKLAQAADWLREMNIGGTAVGTGINAEPEYPRLMVGHLQQVSALELREGQDRIQLMQSMGDIASFSGALRAYVLDLNKIANDIRLLASGPRTGLAEIVLPAVQPGSSIMPGKVNPSIAEMVNQVCYQALGLDQTVAMAAEAGQLELNVMMPVITHNIVFALTIVGNASRVLAERCVDGIEADAAQCAYWLERSPALVTALAPKIGYAEAAKLAKEAVATGLTVKQLLEKKKLLPKEELDEVLDLRAMTEIGVPGGKGIPAGRLSACRPFDSGDSAAPPARLRLRSPVGLPVHPPLDLSVLAPAPAQCAAPPPGTAGRPGSFAGAATARRCRPSPRPPSCPPACRGGRARGTRRPPGSGSAAPPAGWSRGRRRSPAARPPRCPTIGE